MRCVTDLARIDALASVTSVLVLDKTSFTEHGAQHGRTLNCSTHNVTYNRFNRHFQVYPCTLAYDMTSVFKETAGERTDYFYRPMRKIFNGFLFRSIL